MNKRLPGAGQKLRTTGGHQDRSPCSLGMLTYLALDVGIEVYGTMTSASLGTRL
jgi:allophanate hydrolase subunit 2